MFFSRDVRLRSNTAGAGSTFNPSYFDSSGYRRVLNQVVTGAIYDDIIWEGRQGVDWNNFGVAKVDSKRLNVVYDKTVTINSGNQSGAIRDFRIWHPINKTLIYDDEEAGGDETLSAWSVTDKRGCGDMFVMDIIFPTIAVTQNSYLRFNPQATLYWHEK